jgi:hypothetical protein
MSSSTPPAVDDLILWYVDQIDADEGYALNRRELCVCWQYDTAGQCRARPDCGLRISAEATVKRELLRRGGLLCDCQPDDQVDPTPMDNDPRWQSRLRHRPGCAVYPVVRMLAEPLASRVGYREEWRPRPGAAERPRSAPSLKR